MGFFSSVNSRLADVRAKLTAERANRADTQIESQRLEGGGGSASATSTPAHDISQSQQGLRKEGAASQARVRAQISETRREQAQELIDANTTVHRNVRNGRSSETINITGIAEDIVHISHQNPTGAGEMMEHAQDLLGDRGLELEDAVTLQLARDEQATQRLLRATEYQPQEPGVVDEVADRLLDEHTKTSTPFRHRDPVTRVDVNSMSYALETMAEDSPSMAAAARAELATRLDAEDAADMNRILAGEADFEENIGIAVQNPVDGALGAGKGMVNGLSDLAEISHRASPVGFALDMHHRATNNGEARDVFPTFEMDNRAQEGGQVIGTAIDIALAGKGLVTGGAKLLARNADETAGLGSRGLTGLSPSDLSYEKLSAGVKDLDVSTPRDSAVFYSGKGARASAESYATQNQLTTLEQTPGGEYLDDLRLFDGTVDDVDATGANRIWGELSSEYARRASGDVTAIVNNPRPNSIFLTEELPALLGNENVTQVTVRSASGSSVTIPHGTDIEDALALIEGF